MELPGCRLPQQPVALTIEVAASTANLQQTLVLKLKGPNPRPGSIRISNTSRSLLDSASLFLLFLQEIISGRRPLCRRNPGPRAVWQMNNSGTMAHIGQPICLLRILAKIAYSLKVVNQHDVIPSPPVQGAGAAML
jgi:hypothetical protein